MSEKMLALLLRLYPAPFRQRYRWESMQLVRDRLRDEHGTLRRARIWIEVFLDLAWALPQAYRNSYPTPAPIPYSTNGVPVFASLEPEPLKRGSVVLASVFAAGALALFSFLMTQVSAYHPFAGSTGRLSAAPNGKVGNPDVQKVAQRVEKDSRTAGQLENCGFDKLGLLPGNLGYVRINWLGSPAACGTMAQSVMSRLDDADAIILDLRDCGAGDHDMAHLMESTLGPKPLYVLLSTRSTPAAQQFASALKARKNAIVIAEDGGPSAHWIAAHPDVRVHAGDAVQAAEKLALAALHRS